MKIKHLSLLVFSAASFCASCGCSANNNDQKILNDANAVIEKSETPIITCHDAVLATQEAGIDLEAHHLAQDDYCFAFDFDAKRFVIMNEAGDVVHSSRSYERNKDTYRYFRFTNAYDPTSVYSQYLTKDFAGADILVVTTGLDMGANWNVKNLTYYNESTIAKNIVLRTYSDYLTIMAPTDNIVHYGDANNVFITEMNDDKEFHAYGTYAYIQPSAGNIYLEQDSSVDLFELKENSTAKVNVAPGVTVEAAINAPMIPAKNDLNIHEINENNYQLITDAEIKPNKTNFFRLNSDVDFPVTTVDSTNAWLIENNFFLDLNGHKISFTGNQKSIYEGKSKVDGDKYHIGILLEANDTDLEGYIIDTQSTRYERPSIELNDCSIIVAGNEEHSAKLNITSGQISDIRGVANDFSPEKKPEGWLSYNNPAVLVIGNTTNTPDKRTAYNSSFDMYGGYIRSKIGPKLQERFESGQEIAWPFKCIQPRGEGATVNMSYGDLYSHAYCISGQGVTAESHDQFGGTIVNITGGTIVGGLGHYPSDDGTTEDVYTPLFFPQGGNLNITGGNITGPTCLDMKSGTATIDGGIFTATRQYEEIYCCESGSIADGSVILLEPNTHYSGGDIKVDITDAKMISQHGYITNIIPIKATSAGHEYKNVNATHSGGTYFYALNKGTHIGEGVPTTMANITVTGGTWTPSNR